MKDIGSKIISVAPKVFVEGGKLYGKLADNSDQPWRWQPFSHSGFE